MKSYYCEGAGLPAFLKRTHTIKEMLTNYFQYERGALFGRNMSLVYIRSIDNVCGRSKELFEREPAMLFRIELIMPKKQLFIRIKNGKKEIITILTASFSWSAGEIEARSKESEGWSNDAFRHALREWSKSAPGTPGRFFLNYTNF